VGDRPERISQVSGEIRDRQGTNRTLPDTRTQYLRAIRAMRSRRRSITGRAIRTITTRGILQRRHHASEWNEAYAFGGIGNRAVRQRVLATRERRSHRARALSRRISSVHQVKINDGSISGGRRGDASGWKWDLGTVYGNNSFDFTIDNTANVSLGPSSKTSFYAGQLAFRQSTTTLDLFREVSSPWYSPVRLALCGEFRRDLYEITAGEADSYRNGGVKVLDASGNPTTRLAAVGSQVFQDSSRRTPGHIRGRTAQATSTSRPI
jgi:iron complex outermembrane receptor protein